ncbi:histidinol-phosphate transaminase [Neisseria leonii]|uniref:Histidinol-phosphate aminotransferase n=1 Tax=Neisseria leonii TaxID=2995413 RepID=A0A9X4E1D3_9NEIS|nr:histidinol-phosphate transaminase [Neisseria sp. 51.81]MDD9326790.1 histidinol-phosphate transaminase [Neisseria sp. 51.81]
MGRISEIIRQDIQNMQAYAVADVPPGSIKLDAMELPYRFEPPLMEALVRELVQAQVNLYPNPAVSGLQPLLKEVFRIPEQAQVVLGNGSDELIQLMTMLVAKPGAKVMALGPSFVMYRHNAQLFGLDYIEVPLHADFTLNLPALLAALDEHRPDLLFIAYPNNPSGVCFSRDEVAAAIEAAPGLVVVDEAYGAFSEDSFLNLSGCEEKLVVIRTLSKIGFAGLRIGYAAGHPAVMGELAKIVPPYNMNQLSLVAAKFALRHYDWVAEKVALLKAERGRLFDGLSALPGVTVFASQTNFLTIRVPDAASVFEALRESGIWVKKLHGSHPLLAQCLRITVGTPEQNTVVLANLGRILAG